MKNHLKECFLSLSIDFGGFCSLQKFPNCAFPVVPPKKILIKIHRLTQKCLFIIFISNLPECCNPLGFSWYHKWGLCDPGRGFEQLCGRGSGYYPLSQRQGWRKEIHLGVHWAAPNWIYLQWFQKEEMEHHVNMR